ncbi:MAG: helix-turn-helix transcriptional regulator [Armatimonadetes bacterium]|nr:helix-turn-helix transcriptional regulator [Armatimonadota bacterium]
MSKKKGDFEKHLDKYSKDPFFAKIFKEEQDKLRVAVKITELREKKGFTQKELAKRIHTTQSVISRLESSNYENYSIQTLKKIANALNAKLIIDLEYR